MDITRRRARMNLLWTKKAPYEAIFRECFDLFMPNRRPGRTGKTAKPPVEIFDMTGPNSARHFPGELKRIVIPDGQPFIVRAGPLIANKLKASELVQWNAKLGLLSSAIYPFFQTGKFDDAINDAFTDLAVTNAYIMPLKGPSIEEPLFFRCLPTDQVAVQWDGYGRLGVLNWKKQATLEEIFDQWPNGKYPPDFAKRLKEKPDDMVTLLQDFERVKSGGWQFTAYMERDGEAIVTESYKTQPVAAIRFYVTPDDDYSLGPVPFALPTVRTQNQAQKLALKAFAIQMLGLWGYRAGGTFNPDTVKLAPGAFLPMQSTGGVMGPDISRLDASTGRIDLARMLLSTGQQQIRDALLDTRLVDDGGTPASAQEIAAKIRQNANTHVGSNGRVINDLLPVLVPRGMEILSKWQLLPDLMTFNELLVSIEVVSPMARALKVAEFEAAAQYLQFLMQLDAENVDLYIIKDELAALVREALMVPGRVVPDEKQKEAAAQAAQQRQQAAMLAQMATKAAPNIADAALAPQQAAA